MQNALTQTVFGRRLSKQYTLADALTYLNKQNLINIGELAELAISKASGVSLCERMTPNIDLVTGKQIKHAQTNPETQKTLKAWFSKNTDAPIMLVVTERLTNQQYYFYIEYKDYKHINANAIAIPFNSDGSPKTDNYWWNHKVDSFDELCSLAK